MNAVLIKEYSFFFTRQHILVINKSWIFFKSYNYRIPRDALIASSKKNK
jgi:hypothetical protein